MRLLIKGGRVIDPVHNVDDILDILIEGGKIIWISKVGDSSQFTVNSKGKKSVNSQPSTVDRVLDAKGLVVCPGFIDLHAHLREPGREDEETIATGTQAAARGGFTAVCAMPNTDPINDNQSVTEFILDKAKREGLVHVFPVGALSKGQKGEELAEIGDLYKAGCLAISDDGRPVMNAELMRHAMEYASMFNMQVISHCEDLNLSRDGVMHEGLVSTELGLRGVPAAAEEVMVARDLILAEMTGARLHLAHVSAAGSVRLIREAKARGVRITAEVTPHHLVLTEETVRGFNTNAKMNPPLRSAADREALWEGLHDGTIDAIATDHAPHALAEKDVEFDYAPFGIIGLETAVGIVLTVLVGKGALSLSEAIARFSTNPARILGLNNKGHLGVGADADLTILDLKREWRVDVSGFSSKSRNSPFDGWHLRGMPVLTLVEGKVVWEAQ
ncbi:MAG: dihydroorotase [candidate division NC10 bacterium]|nr:dihydroorotase [candidate division NC10 bacterium]